MADTITVYASIGNSDDKLAQVRWAEFHETFAALIHRAASQVYGDWQSVAASKWQNACIAFEIDADGAERLKQVLAGLAAEYEQDSIAWAAAATEFIGPDRSRYAAGGPVRGPLPFVGEDGCCLPSFCTCDRAPSDVRTQRTDCPMHHPATPAQHITFTVNALGDRVDVEQAGRDAVRRLRGSGGALPS